MFDNAQAAVDKAKEHLFKAVAHYKLSPEQLKSVEDQFLDLNSHIIQHLPDIQQVMDSWHDKFSKIQYANYMMYVLLSKVNFDLASDCDPNMPMSTINDIKRNFKDIVAKRNIKIPKLILPRDPK